MWTRPSMRKVPLPVMPVNVVLLASFRWGLVPKSGQAAIQTRTFSSGLRQRRPRDLTFVLVLF